MICEKGVFASETGPFYSFVIASIVLLFFPLIALVFSTDLILLKAIVALRLNFRLGTMEDGA